MLGSRVPLRVLAFVIAVAGPVAAQRPRATTVDLSGIDSVVSAMMTEWRVPGLELGVIRNGQVVYSKGYGYRDVEKKLPVTPRTLMAIGSNTKSFTVVLLGMAADQKKLEWDKPVTTYLPSFKLYDAYATEHMTPRDLVTHRSGLPRHDALWYGRAFTRREMFDRLRYLQPNVSFREKWQYQNLMFLTAGMLAEELSGRSWEDLIKEKIFAPLGMTHSLPGAKGVELTDDFSWPYTVRHDSTVRIPVRNIDHVGPAGSINSNIEDMLKYVRFRIDLGEYNGRRLLSREADAEMQTGQMAVGRPAQDIWPGFDFVTYGMGLAEASYRGHRVLVHGGGIDGFISQMSWLPEEQTGVVVLTNRGGPNPVPTMVVQAVYDRILGLEPKDWAAVQRTRAKEAAARGANATRAKESARKQGTRPSHDLPAYAGTYQHPGYGTIIIRIAGGSLEVVLDDIVQPLRHYHYDIFDLGNPGEDVLSGLVPFTTNAAGEVSQVAIVLESTMPAIVFTRVR